MSDNIAIEVIKLIGSVLVAVIGAYGVIQSARINNQKGRPRKKISLWSNVIKWAAAVFLLCGVFYFVFQVIAFSQMASTASKYPVIDLGSTFPASGHSSVTQIGRIAVYSHYPIGKVRYTDIDPDDRLIRVDKVCGNRVSNITDLFIPKPDTWTSFSDYESPVIEVSNSCRIDFTVQDELGGDIGIELKGEYVP